MDKAQDIYDSNKSKFDNIDWDDVQDQIYGKTSELLEGENLWQSLLESVVDFSMEEFRQDYKAQAEYMENATKIVDLLNENGTRDLMCNMRGDLNPKDIFMFAPEEAAFLHFDNPKASWEGTCFKNIEAELVEKDDKSGVQVKMTLSDPKSLTCADWFLAGNTGMKHLAYYFLHGEKTITFDYTGQDSIDDTAFNGISMY